MTNPVNASRIPKTLLAMIAVTLASLPVAAQDFAHQRQSLRRLPGVAVLVEMTANVERDFDMTENAIKTDVEIALRRAGVTVFSLEDVRAFLPTPSSPW